MTFEKPQQDKFETTPLGEFAKRAEEEASGPEKPDLAKVRELDEALAEFEKNVEENSKNSIRFEVPGNLGHKIEIIYNKESGVFSYSENNILTRFAVEHGEVKRLNLTDHNENRVDDEKLMEQRRHYIQNLLDEGLLRTPKRN